MRRSLAVMLLCLLPIAGCGREPAEVPTQVEQPEPALPPETTVTAEPSYEIRQFEPVGTGRVVIDDQELIFDVANCDLDPVELPNGFTRHLQIIGAGTRNGRSFFVAIRYERHENRVSSNLTIFDAPLPARLLELDKASEADMQTMQAVMDAEMLRVPQIHPDNYIISDGSVTLSQPEKAMILDHEGNLEREAMATFEVSCQRP